MRITSRLLILLALLLPIPTGSVAAVPDTPFAIESSHSDSDLEFRGEIPWVVPKTGAINGLEALAPFFIVYGTTRSTGWWTILLKGIGRDDRYQLELSEFESREANSVGKGLVRKSRTISRDDACLLYDTWVRLALSVRYGPQTFPAGRSWGFVSHMIGVRKGALGYVFGTSIHLESHPRVRIVREIGDALKEYVEMNDGESAAFPEELRLRFSQLNLLLRDG
ncbi:MAG: hypothetical protein U1F61_18725 [Opitutaceae bacterium]